MKLNLLKFANRQAAAPDFCLRQAGDQSQAALKLFLFPGLYLPVRPEAYRFESQTGQVSSDNRPD